MPTPQDPYLPYQLIVVTTIKQARKLLLMEHVKTVSCPLVTLTHPELLTALTATRYSIFSQRNHEDGITNPTHAVRPAGRRNLKANRGAKKVNQAQSVAPAWIDLLGHSLLSIAVLLSFHFRSLPSLNRLSRHHWRTKCSARANRDVLRSQPISKSTYA